MSERMNPIPFDKLLDRVLTEYAQEGTVFGVHAKYEAERPGLPLFGGRIETPFGPAAGPNTQLSENIVAGYFTGARFFELKTVQKMDGEDLARCISRPCIKADDEGYNCEWSTELTVPQAFTEYVNAYVVIKIISKLWHLGDPNGFMFSMSVGYDLAGIKTEKIDTFIEGMKDASRTEAFQKAIQEAKKQLPELADYIDGIDPHICTSVTISTLHGCPSQEIESIASYLITEKKLHTLVKCNPTILGYDFARKRLNEAGFDYVSFDDHHFREDLQYKDAVPMFHRLIKLAADNGVTFGLKLSNTCPVDVKAGELPSEEMYMSGKSLYLLTIEMAARMAEEFDGKLRLSFSGGADAFNLKALFRAGIWPITVATTILKPGGYDRFRELADEVSRCAYKPFTGVNPAAVRALSDKAAQDVHHRKPIKPLPSRKSQEQVPLLSCFTAPCQGGCPIHQDIPGYLALNEKGKYPESLKLITEKNALPFITGTICAHPCMSRCTRNFYDESVNIRKAKLTAARKGFGALMARGVKKEHLTKAKVAVVGGGPAGMAAAFYLSRAGAKVTVFEKEKELGGTVRHVIPAFRIPAAAIDRDVKLISSLGANFVLGAPAPALSELEKEYDYILLAVGAEKASRLDIGGKEYNAIEFLKALKRNDPVELGEHVIVIGAGNTAMDCARAALRVPGVKDVSIVYRRTKKYMPADEEEMLLALKEGVQFKELLAPMKADGESLLCHRMVLGEPDASGRRSPVDTGEEVSLPCSALIASLGEKVDTDLLLSYGAGLNEKGRPVLRNGKIFVLGDARRGPATVVEAMADALAATEAIVGEARSYALPKGAEVGEEKLVERKSLVKLEGDPEDVCMHCNELCENCVSVCPNRANAAIRVPGKKEPQILHLDYLCNECGNCASFCPYASRPYKDKFTLFENEKDFADSTNQGFCVTSLKRKQVKVRLNGIEKKYDLAKENDLDKDIEVLILTVLKDYPYLLV